MSKRKGIVIIVLLLAVMVMMMVARAQNQGGAANSSFTTLQPAGQTVGSLPNAATSNQGQIRVVTDSTSISAEGQACSGGSSTVALAFSTGSGWKCF